MRLATVVAFAGLSLVAVGCKKKPASGLPDAGVVVAAVDAGATPMDASAPLDEIVDAAAELGTATVDAGHKVVAAGPPPFVVGDTWTGTYNCGANNKMELKVTAVAGNHVNGVFDFKMHNRKTGSFTVSGTYEPATKHILLNAGTWIEQPKGVETLNLDGVVGDDKHSYTGKVTGPNPKCVGFSARR